MVPSAKVRGVLCSSVCPRVAVLKREDPDPRYDGGKQQLWTPELLDDIHEFTEEDNGPDFSDKCFKPLHFVSYLQSSTCDPYRVETTPTNNGSNRLRHDPLSI